MPKPFTKLKDPNYKGTFALHIRGLSKKTKMKVYAFKLHLRRQQPHIKDAQVLERLLEIAYHTNKEPFKDGYKLLKSKKEICCTKSGNYYIGKCSKKVK